MIGPDTCPSGLRKQAPPSGEGDFARGPQWATTIIPARPDVPIRRLDAAGIAARFPALANVVEDVADLDIVADGLKHGVAVAILPSTLPHFVVQYRAPLRSARRFGEMTRPHERRQHVATTVRSGVVTISPDGPVGVVIARLRPEAAPRLLGDRLCDTADAKIDLDALFGAELISTLEDRLAEARSSDERTSAVLRFLLANMRSRSLDPSVCRAAAILRSNPILRMGPLAAELGLSERHLMRRFKAVFGVGPKQFARCTRLEHVWAAFGSGSSWAGIAAACGFADQAHMINDFKAILGVTPAELFRSF